MGFKTMWFGRLLPELHNIYPETSSSFSSETLINTYQSIRKHKPDNERSNTRHPISEILLQHQADIYLFVVYAISRSLTQTALNLIFFKTTN